MYRRVSKVINRAILVDLFFYMVISLAGYFSQFEDTAAIVLERNLLPGIERDYFLLVGIAAVMMCVMVAYPLYVNPFRQIFFSMVLGKDQFTQTENVILCTIYLSVTCFISIIFPNIS